MDAEDVDNLPLAERLKRRGAFNPSISATPHKEASPKAKRRRETTVKLTPKQLRQKKAKATKGSENSLQNDAENGPAKGTCTAAAEKGVAVPALTFDYESVDIEAECDVSACVSLESVPDEGCDAVDIGSGVCVDSRGLVLTAGHVAPVLGCYRIAAFADGVTFHSKCIAVSETWDLALLQLTEKQAGAPVKRKGKGKKGKRTKTLALPFVRLSGTPPARKDRIVCVGQPGRPRGERLEVVTGKVVSVVADPLADQNNEDMDGGLQHSCPVFAGNSGSAILMASTGELVGMHTGFNHRRFSYHGTTLEAIQAFLDSHRKF